MIPGVSQFANIAKGVGNYVGNIARNVRDVPTAVGTNIQIARKGGADAMQGKPLDVAGHSNLVNQVKEVAGALVGNPGTRSDQYTPSTGYMPAGKVASPSTQPVAKPTPTATKTPIAKPTPTATASPKSIAPPIPAVKPKNTPMIKPEKPIPTPSTVT